MCKLWDALHRTKPPGEGNSRQRTSGQGGQYPPSANEAVRQRLKQIDPAQVKKMLLQHVRAALPPARRRPTAARPPPPFPPRLSPRRAPHARALGAPLARPRRRRHPPPEARSPLAAAPPPPPPPPRSRRCATARTRSARRAASCATASSRAASSRAPATARWRGRACRCAHRRRALAARRLPPLAPTPPPHHPSSSTAKPQGWLPWALASTRSPAAAAGAASQQMGRGGYGYGGYGYGGYGYPGGSMVAQSPMQRGGAAVGGNRRTKVRQRGREGYGAPAGGYGGGYADYGGYNKVGSRSPGCARSRARRRGSASRTSGRRTSTRRRRRRSARRRRRRSPRSSRPTRPTRSTASSRRATARSRRTRARRTRSRWARSSRSTPRATAGSSRRSPSRWRTIPSASTATRCGARTRCSSRRRPPPPTRGRRGRVGSARRRATSRSCRPTRCASAAPTRAAAPTGSRGRRSRSSATAAASRCSSSRTRRSTCRRPTPAAHRHVRAPDVLDVLQPPARHAAARPRRVQVGRPEVHARVHPRRRRAPRPEPAELRRAPAGGARREVGPAADVERGPGEVVPVRQVPHVVPLGVRALRRQQYKKGRPFYCKKCVGHEPETEVVKELREHNDASTLQQTPMGAFLEAEVMADLGAASVTCEPITVRVVSNLLQTSHTPERLVAHCSAISQPYRARVPVPVEVHPRLPEARRLGRLPLRALRAGVRLRLPRAEQEPRTSRTSTRCATSSRRRRATARRSTTRSSPGTSAGCASSGSSTCTSGSSRRRRATSTSSSPAATSSASR